MGALAEVIAGYGAPILKPVKSAPNFGETGNAANLGQTQRLTLGVSTQSELCPHVRQLLQRLF